MSEQREEPMRNLDQNTPTVLCAWCKSKTRHPRKGWQSLTGALHDSDVSHGICPDCYRSLCLDTIQKAIIRQTLGSV
ncbi:MAG: hypothetical protein AAF629_13260 [Chloroflexota bacterium]